MALILSIDYDRRRTGVLVDLVRDRVQAELVRAWSAKDGLDALAGRTPDLILTPPFHPPKDEELVVAYLRALGSAGTHVQRLTTPTFRESADADGDAEAPGAAASPQANRRSPAGEEGSDPRQFADRIRAALAVAASRRRPVEASPPAPGASPVPRVADAPPRGQPPGREPVARGPAGSSGDLYVSAPADEAWAARTRQPIDALARPAVPGEAPVPVVDIGSVDDLDALAQSFAVNTERAAPSDIEAPPREQPTEPAAVPSPIAAAPGVAVSVVATPPELRVAQTATEEVRPAAAAPAPKTEPVVVQPVEPEQPAAAPLPARKTELAAMSPAEPAPPAEPARVATRVNQTPGIGGAPSEPRRPAEPEPTPAPAQSHAALDDEALNMIGEAAFNALLFDPTDSIGPEPAPMGPPPEAVPAVAAVPEAVQAPRAPDAAAPPPPPAAAQHHAPPDQPIESVEKPSVDEWGIFDPEKAGFEALLRRQGGPEPGSRKKKGKKGGRA